LFRILLLISAILVSVWASAGAVQQATAVSADNFCPDCAEPVRSYFRIMKDTSEWSSPDERAKWLPFITNALNGNGAVDGPTFARRFADMTRKGVIFGMFLKLMSDDTINAFATVAGVDFREVATAPDYRAPARIALAKIVAAARATEDISASAEATAQRVIYSIEIALRADDAAEVAVAESIRAVATETIRSPGTGPTSRDFAMVATANASLATLAAAEAIRTLSGNGDSILIESVLASSNLLREIGEPRREVGDPNDDSR
jgi:hypothetical protein